MTRSILVPLDGSRFAEAALPLAVALARKACASIHLIHAHEAVPAALGHGGVVGTEADRSEERAYLAEMAGRLERGALEVSFQFVDGPAVEALETWIAEHRPSLVVLATHGRGSLDPLWLGSVAEHLARCTAAPLLLVRPEDGEPQPMAAATIRRVLAPIDFAEGHEALVDRLGEFAGFVQAHVTLLHVLTPSRGLPEEPPPAPPVRQLVWQSPAELGAQRWLDRLADRLRARGVAAAARVVKEPDIGSAVLAYADRIGADVVAMHAHGCGDYQDGTIGPVVDQVVRGARAPVLILPPLRGGPAFG